MTKVSEARSALRRRVLVKAADEYSDIVNGYSNANRGIVGAGVRVAANDNLRKSGYPPPPQPPATPKPDIKQQMWGEWKQNFRTNRAAAQKAYGDLKGRLSGIMSRFRPAQAPSPVVSATATTPVSSVKAPLGR